MDFSFLRALTASVRLTLATSKKDVKRLQKATPELFGREFPLSVCQEAYARARGFRHWHELEQVAQRLSRDREMPFWSITSRNDFHESVLSAIVQSELEMTENGPVVFLGNSADSVVPALCLWAEEISAARVPGVILIDSHAMSVQDTALWEVVDRFGLATMFSDFRIIDTREASIPLAISTTAFSWTRALSGALSVDEAKRVEESGMRHLIERMLEDMATVRGAEDSRHADVFMDSIETVMACLCASHPIIPGQLHDLPQDARDRLANDFGKYIADRPQREMKLLSELVSRMSGKGLRLGRVLSSETPHRPSIVLFDSDQPETVVLAAAIHSLYYWRYVGFELRHRGISTRPVLYYSDRADLDIPRFLLDSSAGHTCLASGLTKEDIGAWSEYRTSRTRRTRLVHVERGSFVFCGRRVQITDAGVL